jgi:prepilin-type N-terminal cleavage/methylation domain-containing protein
MTSQKTQAGVTLIEVLIAVSLLGLLSVGVLTAMQLGLRTMDRVDARMVRNRRVTSARNIIENEISGFVSTMATLPQNRLAVFLQTEPQSMRFVTSYSLGDAWRGRPQIAGLQVIPGEGNTGVRLIVNETPYTGPAQAGQFVSGIEPDLTGRPVTRFAPIVPGPDSFVLADRLRYCRFLYLERRPIEPFEIWRPDWVLPGAYPSGVRIEMASLDDSPADLHPFTITVPIKVTVPPGVHYAQ